MIRCKPFVLFGILLLALNGCASISPEERDFGVNPRTTLKTTDYSEPTPLTVPGAKVIKTSELKSMVDRKQPPILVDVLGGYVSETIPGAFWLRGAGLGNLPPEETEKLKATLSQITAGDNQKEIVFFCLSPECWLSYNAVLRASSYGYKNIYWYRGGIEAWKDAGNPVKSPAAAAMFSGT